MSELFVRDPHTLTDSGPAAGDIQFCDNYLPPLKDGTYTITMAQTLASVSTPPPNQETVNEDFSKTQQFAIAGPRFQFPSTDIQAVYPPDKSQGQFEQKLPYIVLTKRALPWERNLSPSAPATTPWLALLLLREEEIQPASGNNSGLANPTKASTFTATQMTQSEVTPSGERILKPAIKLDPLDDPNTLCRTIDIAPATFKAVVPQDNELPYLAHCRNVNLQDKEEGLVSGNGWFSIVMANRLPLSTQQPVRYIAHLVSLEGFSDYIRANQPTPIPDDVKSVRLISLASWTFTCLPQAGEDFRTIMTNLIQGQSSGGAGLLLKMPFTGTATTPDQQLAQTILNRGYVPLNYRVLSGEQTYAWYRSPLTPVPVKQFASIEPYSTAAAALIYDQTTGVFDQSYAIAWQTGRLLALADRAFTTNWMNWKQQGNQTVDLLYHRLNSPHVATELKQTDTVEQLRALLHPTLISESFMSYLINEFANEATPHITALGTERVQPFRAENNGNYQTSENHLANNSSTLIANLKQFMQHPDMPSMLPRAVVAHLQASGADITDDLDNAIPKTITDWLSQLCLLYGVPFSHLVPNEAMLPTESIRFFYVDPNFIDALVDGATSIGIHSKRDRLFTQIMRPCIRAAVFQTLPTIRHRLVGTQLNDTDGFEPTPPLAGFLLRSAAVAGWPGLEMKVYSAYNPNNPQQNQLMTFLRMERLTPDTLLCLCPTIPVRIEFDEPKEGLSFGVEDGKISLRTIEGSSPGSHLPDSPTVPATCRNNTPDILNIGQITTAIQQILQSKGQLPAGTPLSSSQFVIQLVRSPEQMVFKNQ